MIDYKTGVNFRIEVTRQMDNILGGIENNIRNGVGSEKIKNVADYVKKFRDCEIVLDFMDEWNHSRLLDPKEKRK